MGARMDLSNPGTTEIVVALAAPVVLAAYVGLIVIPAWTSYGRWWERFAATFLTLYILAVLVGIGAAIGLGIIWSYDEWAA
jgi:membrane protein YdbS with pleckstrin-like domain